MKYSFCLLLVIALLGCGAVSPPGPAQEKSGSKYPPGVLPNMSTEVGAGGSGVYCPNYFEITDVYEARKRGMAPSLGAAHLSVPEKIEIALARLERVSPERAKRYRERAKFILEKAYFFKKGYLPHIADEDPQDIGEGCVLVTIATRRKPIFPTDPEFLINDQLWQLLDNDNRAALVLHEVVYEEAFTKFGQRTSRFSRALLSQIFSASLEKLCFAEFVAFLDVVEFSRTDLDGLQISTKLRKKDASGTGTVIDAAGEWVISAEAGQDIHAGLPAQRYRYAGAPLWVGGGYSPAFAFRHGRLRIVSGYVFADTEAPLSDRGNTLLLAGDDISLTVFGEDGLFALVSVRKNSLLRQADGTALKIATDVACVSLTKDGVATLVASGYCGPRAAAKAAVEMPPGLKKRMRED